MNCPECHADAVEKSAGNWLLCASCNYSWLADPTRHVLAAVDSDSSLPDAPVAAGGEVEARRPPGVAISDAALRRQLSGEGSAAADPSTPLRPS